MRVVKNRSIVYNMYTVLNDLKNKKMKSKKIAVNFMFASHSCVI